MVFRFSWGKGLADRPCPSHVKGCPNHELGPPTRIPFTTPPPPIQFSGPLMASTTLALADARSTPLSACSGAAPNARSTPLSAYSGAAPQRPVHAFVGLQRRCYPTPSPRHCRRAAALLTAARNNLFLESSPPSRSASDSANQCTPPVTQALIQKQFSGSREREFADQPLPVSYKSLPEP